MISSILENKKIDKKFLSNLKNKRVTVMGLGSHGGGVGVVKFLAKKGAKILITDLKPKEELGKSLEKLEGISAKYVLGQHRSEDFINTDLVIKNPGVPNKSKYLKIARENKVPIETDIGIFFELCPAPIIGVTGTRGKSTTATLIAEIFKKKYKKVVLAGNIRKSVLTELKNIDRETIVVLELSSWQLAGAANHLKSPHIAVVTNIFPDHLNRYDSFESYIDDKKLIFRFQKKRDFLVINYNDPIVRNFALKTRSQIYFYASEKGIPEINFLQDKTVNIGCWLKGVEIVFGQEGKRICQLNEIKLRGEHNLTNILAAATVAMIYNIKPKLIYKTLKEFSGLEGRLELVSEINGVKYINDTTATIPEATIAAIRSFPLKKKKIILIAGGADKNLNFESLAKIIMRRVKGLILLEGTATKKLREAVEKRLVGKKLSLPIYQFDNMESAVWMAKELSESGDIVLLSPACASFGLFKHEFDRGDQFKNAVNQINYK